jgi:hypothetical protein
MHCSKTGSLFDHLVGAGGRLRLEESRLPSREAMLDVDIPTLDPSQALQRLQLFDDLVGEREQCWRDIQRKRPSGL